MNAHRSDKELKSSTPKSLARQEKIDQVIEWLCQGYDTQWIYKSSLRLWNKSPSSTARYIRAAKSYLASQSSIRRDEEIGKALVRLNELFGAAFRTNDRKNALAAQQEINRLLNLYDTAPPPPTLDPPVIRVTYELPKTKNREIEIPELPSGSSSD